MKWYYNGVTLESHDDPSKEFPIVMTMVVKFNHRQVSHMRTPEARSWLSFAEKDARNSISAVSPIAVVGLQANFEDPRKGEIFGSIRVVVRTDWPKTAITTALLRWQKRIVNHANLSGYNLSGARRRVLSGKDRKIASLDNLVEGTKSI